MQPSLCRSLALNPLYILQQVSYPNYMMHAVDVTVSDVDSDGPEGETVLFSRAMDGNGRAQHTDCWAEISAG